MDIIILALPRTDHKYSSTSFSLAKELSKKHRVFYIENPFTIKDYLSIHSSYDIQIRKKALLFGKDYVRSVEGLPEGFHQVITKLVIPVNWLPPGWLYDLLSKINDRIVHSTVKALIQDFGIKDYIYINSFNPFYGKFFPKAFKPKLFIYHTVDDISQAIHVNKHGLRLENHLVKKANITITTSSELKRLKSEISSQVYCVPNAADISVFSSVFHETYPLPEEFRSIDKKIVIYVGNIKDRIDFKLCKLLAEARPNLAFFFIGPINTDEHIKVGLASLSNAYFIGGKRINELPAFLQHAHCTIIPFEYTKLTKSIYPLKINEYLAAGMPVVATRFSEDIESFTKVIYLATTPEDFLNCLDKAIHENSGKLKQLRLEAAKGNSWSDRAEQLQNIIGLHLTT